MRKLICLAAFALVACTPANSPSSDLCRAGAVALANKQADDLCANYEWADCPAATRIEGELMDNLEKCDE